MNIPKPILYSAPMMGAALGIQLGTQMAREEDRILLRDAIKNDVKINASDILDKYPNLFHVHSKRSLLKAPISPLQKEIIAPRLGRPAYLNIGNGQGIIVSPKKISQSLLGNEIGHSLDDSSEATFFDNVKRLVNIDALTGKRYKEERKAWEDSPLPVNQDVMDNALETYSKTKNYSRIDAAVGLIMASSPIWFPKLYGNIR